MKNEHDFMESMWYEISKLEFDAKQNQRAKEQNKKLLLKEFLIYSSITVLCSLGFLLLNLIHFTGQEIAYMISVPVLLAAFVVENRISIYGGLLNEN